MSNATPPSKTFGERIAGFMVGILIVLFGGWGVAFASYVLIGPIVKHPALVALIASGPTLVLFAFLERGFWLSRLMGLRVTPGESPWKSVIMLWLFGVAWLFIRATVLDVQSAPASTNVQKTAPPPPRDATREVVETIVFVVALVLMLKLFVVEAFVIPTGSMAETLLGYNKVVTCDECGHVFPVNATDEADPQHGERREIVGARCPNCTHLWQWSKDPGYLSGDRVLVHKALGGPDRGDVVVFKFPVSPQIKHTAQNYIKRLWGLGGETIAVYRGDLYMTRSLVYPADEADAAGQKKYPRPENAVELWQGGSGGPAFANYTYWNAAAAVDLFEASRKTGFDGSNGGFVMIRKSDANAIAMRRTAYDNDHQSKKLADLGVPARWSVDGDGWALNSAKMPTVFTRSGGDVAWLRYRHRISGPPTWQGNVLVDDWVLAQDGWKPGLFPPSLITNFIGYNAGLERTRAGAVDQPRGGNGEYWVGDLMLECTAKVGGPADEVVLELSKGLNRFRARFVDGKVSLVRTGPDGRELASRPTTITAAGTYALRFANIDCRLRVWVDGKPIDFGTDADYAPLHPDRHEPFAAVLGGVIAPDAEGSTVANDVMAPASIGAKGAVEVSKVVVWKDTFFTPSGSVSQLRSATEVDTFYVQPGHYLCLGDNSGFSSDGRTWGLVPERLMLGKAVFVFAPFLDVNWRPKFDRVGFIR